MAIAAKYDDGAFKPLEDVNRAEAPWSKCGSFQRPTPKPRQSFRDLPFFGMWADREDIRDGVTYVNRLRQPRY